jgi:hypothetical protein
MGRSNALEIRHVRVPKLKLFKGVRIAAAPVGSMFVD